MFNQFESRLKLEGTLEAITAIRIGAGRATSPTSLDLPVVRDALNRPYIPGSSLKGVLRSHTEAMIRAVLGDRPEMACNPTSEENWCIPSQKNPQRDDIAGIKKRNKGDDNSLTQDLLRHTCLVCQLFGSPWTASKLQIRDLLVHPDTWFGQFQERNGVAIDRDKEVAADRKLYDFEVVPPGVRFAFSAVVQNGNPWQLGMLFAGLRALKEGDVAIGGATSRGLGVVTLDWHSRYIGSNDKEALLDLLIDGKGGKDVDSELTSNWREAFREKLLDELTKGD